MQLLLLLLAVGLIAYGVINDHLLSVAGGSLLAWLAYNPFWRSNADQDGAFFKASFWLLLGRLWKQLLLLALGCSVLAGWLTQRDLFARSPIYAWGAGVLLCLLAGYLHDRQLPQPVKVSDEPDLAGPETEVGWTGLDWLLATSVFLVALGLRLYRLSEFLPPVHGDEGEMGLLALLALQGPTSGVSPQPLPFFSTAFLDHPTLFHYLQALGLWLFGESLVGLRTLSAVVGALCALAAYAIGRNSWGRLAGFVAGWLLAVSHLHIQYSRIALNNIETVLFTMLLIWLLISASKRRQVVPTADPTPAPPMQLRPLLPVLGAGLIMGSGQYLYYGSRLMPILALPLLYYLWRQQRLTVLQIFCTIIAATVAFFPQALHYYYHFITFMNRSTTVNAFTREGMLHTLGPTAAWPENILQLLWHQTQMNLEFFIRQGDRSAFYLADIPGLDQVTAILFWLGVGIALTRLTHFPAVALLVWFTVGIFLAGVLTIDAPNGPRLIVIAPAVYCLGGLAAHHLVQRFGRLWPSYQRPLGLLLGGAVAAVTLYLNFNTYFVNYSGILPGVWQISIAHEIADSAATHRAYLLGTPNYFVEHGTVRFVARAAEKFNVAQHEEFRVTVLNQPLDRGALVIALPQHRAELDLIAGLFPQGEHELHYDPRGNLMYYTYRISVQQVAVVAHGQ